MTSIEASAPARNVCRMTRPDERLQDYVTRGKDRIEGWFARVDAEIFLAILNAQNRKGFRGAIAEIGVHHGKSFIALCLALKSGERALCVDVFDMQSLNIDESGRGVRRVFENNLAKNGIEAKSVEIWARSSMEVTAQQVLDAVGPVRFFSVDGGHWTEITRNDLAVAEGCLAEHGVIALDDFHRPEWPEVSAGYFDWYQNRQRPIVPLAIGFNKLFLCHERCRDEYVAELNKSRFLSALVVKISRFQGHDVPVFSQFMFPDYSRREQILSFVRLYKPDWFKSASVLLRRGWPRS